MTHQTTTSLAGATALVIAGLATAGSNYTIVDIGVVAPGDLMQGLGISPGGVATGRSLGSNQGYSWTEAGGIAPLPNLGSRPFGAANDANDSGVVVGTGATTFFGSSPLPLMWDGGVVSQLPLPAGQTLGRANGVNASNVAVGSVGSGTTSAAIYTARDASVIIATTRNGSFMTTANAISDAGLVAGHGIDPNNAARNVGIVYDSVAGTASDIGALPGLNGALCFGMSNAGHVVGSSMMNQGSGTPFIWTASGGMIEIPLPPSTSQGSARDANSRGLAVGNAGGAFSVPFFFDGKTTVALAELLPDGSPWDLSMNTSSSATGISEGGIITGTGELNGVVHAYALIPAGCVEDLDGSGAVDFGDLLQVLSGWGTPSGDVTGDGTTDFGDLLAVLSTWGPC